MHQTQKKLFEKMKALNLTAEFVATLAGLSPSTIRRAISGLSTLRPAYVAQLTAIVDELSELQDEMNPVPVNFANPQIFIAILESRREQQNGK
jgi:hypothetical protein